MKKTFFTKDPSFYRSFFKLMTVIALQNLVAYSVNMLDNIMLGSYSQNALSGAATVNQIYFIVNQIALAIGNALIAISSQYWGRYYLPSYHTMDFFIFHDQQPFTGHAPQRGDRKNRIPYIRHIPVGERRNQLYPDFRKIRCTGNGNPRCCHRNFCSTHTGTGNRSFLCMEKRYKSQIV